MNDAILTVAFCLLLVLAGAFLLAAFMTFGYYDLEEWEGKNNVWLGWKGLGDRPPDIEVYLKRRWARCSKQVLPLLCAGLAFACAFVLLLGWMALSTNAHRPNHALQRTEAGGTSVLHP